MKRLVLAVLLALPTMIAANPVASDPMPGCLPCPEPKPPVAPMTVPFDVR